MKLTNTVLAVVVALGGCKTIEVAELHYDQKLARLIKLEDERSLGAGEILTRLSEPEPQMRRRAALALGRIGASGTAPRLADLLDDPDDTVRIAAAFSLGLLDGPLPEEVLIRLESALTDPSEEVRARVMEALSRKGNDSTAQKIGASLRERLPSGSAPIVWGEDLESSSVRLPHPELRLGLFAVAKLQSVRWAWGLLATDESHPRFLWWPAAWTASRFAADEMAPLLSHYAGASDPYYRVLGAKGLGGLAPEQSRNSVLSLLEDPEEEVRIEAVRASASLALDEAVPKLLELLATDSLPVQVEVAKVLGKLPDPRTIDPLIDRLHDPSSWIRGAVLRALALEDPGTFWLLLSGMDPDMDWRVRASLARLFGEMEGARSIHLLRQMASERDYRVRPHALRSLAKVSPEAAVPILIEHLTAEDPFERAAAAEGLGRIQPGDVFEALLSAWELSKADKTPHARLAILSALEPYRREIVEPVARDGLDDPEWSVRKRARNVLRGLGDHEATAAEVGSGRYLEDYLNLLRPRFTPHAYIRTEKGAIEVELFVLDAPLTVDNFIRLARRGFYNGLTFHHVEPNVLVEGGDPRGDGNGGPGYTIRDEINRRCFLRGTLGMANEVPDTGGSRFFVTLLPQPQLDGRHTAFGQVISGMDVADRLVPGDLIREIAIWDGVIPPDGSNP